MRKFGKFAYALKERREAIQKLKQLQEDHIKLLRNTLDEAMGEADAARRQDEAQREEDSAAQVVALRGEMEEANQARHMHTRKLRHQAKKIRRKIETVDYAITEQESSDDPASEASVKSMKYLAQQREGLIAEAAEVNQRLVRCQHLSGEHLESPLSPPVCPSELSSVERGHSLPNLPASTK